ncbi:hypothetical protein [Limnoglobus roseus]|nr:hypothetical protein [Limnoglobus roseus]
MAELVSAGVGGATAADLTRDGVTALKELVHEFLGVTVLTSEGRERARALAARWPGNVPVRSGRSSLDTAYQS